MELAATPTRIARLVISHRWLLAELMRRDLRGRFAGARLGLLWSLITPAVQLAAYATLFGTVYTAPGSRHLAGVSPAATLMCGLWPWWAFQEAVTRGAVALVEHGSLLRRLSIPIVLPIIAAASVAILLQMIGFTLFLVSFAMSGAISLKVTWWLLPGLVIIHGLLAIGMALVCAPMYLAARDTLYGLNAGMMLGFFVSPVLFSLDALSLPVRVALAMNPIAVVLQLFRQAVLGEAWVPLALTMVPMAATVGLWRLGARLTSRVEGRIDEYW